MSPRPFVAALLFILTLAMLVARAATRSPQGPVSGAAVRGDLAAVRDYLAAGGDPNTADGQRGSRPLAAASRGSHLAVMDALLAAGADPNVRDAAGNRWVPLMHAVHKHQPRAVRFLLDHRARPDGPPDLRMTPLMMAAATGQAETVQLLLDRGADPRRRSPDGATILTLAVSGGALTDIDEPLLGACDSETVRLLKTRVPDLGIDASWRGWLATWFARVNGCTEVLRLIRASQ